MRRILQQAASLNRLRRDAANQPQSMSTSIRDNDRIRAGDQAVTSVDCVRQFNTWHEPFDRKRHYRLKPVSRDSDEHI